MNQQRRSINPRNLARLRWRRPRRERAGYRPDEGQAWFLLQIFNHGPHVTVHMNGEQVSETHTLKWPHQGSIGFQQHTPGGIIHYRDAKIRSLN